MLITGRNTMLLSIILVLFGMSFSQAAWGTPFIVTKTADTSDGACNGDCSLREAILAANALAGTDDITLPAGTYTITLAALPSVSGSTNFHGAGAAITIIDAGNAVRGFHIGTSITVQLNDLTIRRGLAPGGESGGGIRSNGTLVLNNCRVLDSTAPIAGGGIFTVFSLTIINSTISGNVASGGAGGGGIFSGGATTISNSTISGNTSSDGGGITYSGGANTLNITNTTISGNTATNGFGGGIRNFTGTVNLNNVTVTGNNGANGGGVSNASTLNFRNTIVAGNVSPNGPDCQGTQLNSQGRNIIGNLSFCIIGGDLTGNFMGVSPKLGPLANNGGRTFTHALLASSTGIDAGQDATCSSTDQRNQPRPAGFACDIGAVEFTASVWSRSDSPDTSFDDIAAHPTDPATLYATAGGDGIGILKSTDRGGTWIPVNIGLVDSTVRSIAVDPSNPSTLYAGVQSAFTIMKSTNAGGVWVPSDSGTAGFAFDIAIDPKTPATIYASTLAPGVNKSTNSGGSWVVLSNGLTGNVTKLAINPVTTSTVYAATKDGVFITTDGGANWASSNNGLTDLNINAIEVDPNDPSKVYVGTQSTGVFKSTNVGVTWNPANDGLITTIRSLAIDSVSGILYAGTTTKGIFVSNDEGENWRHLNNGLLGVSQASAIYNVAAITVGSDGVVHAGAGSGLFAFKGPSQYFDDFEDGDADDWAFNKGTWSVLSGDLRGTFNKKADNMSPFGGCSTCVMEGDLTIDTPQARASMLVWFEDKSNMVELVFMEDKDKILLKQKAGGNTVAKGKFSQPVNANQTYHVRIRYDGTKFLVAVDGKPLFEVPTNSTPSGGLGVRVKSTTGQNASVQFREFVAY